MFDFWKYEASFHRDYKFKCGVTTQCCVFFHTYFLKRILTCINKKLRVFRIHEKIIEKRPNDLTNKMCIKNNVL